MNHPSTTTDTLDQADCEIRCNADTNSSARRTAIR